MSAPTPITEMPKPAAFTKFELGVVSMMLKKMDSKRVYLEIGSRFGGTLNYFGSQMDNGGRIIAVDLPGARWGAKQTEASLSHVQGALQGSGYGTDIILGDSHQPRIRAMVIKALDGQPVDVLLIDGDHTREGVEKDVRDYTPLVRSGGMVIFHDCGYTRGAEFHQAKTDPRVTMAQVHPAFVRFADRKRSMIINDAYGTGLVWMP